MRFLSVLLTTILIGIIGLEVAEAQRKTKKLRRKSSAVKHSPIKDSSVINDFKVLFENDQSGVEEPFIFVARSPEQYAQLKNLVQDLPADTTIDWTQNAVVAVFAGQKPTPGYQINVEKNAPPVTAQVAVGVKINLVAPPKDAMLAQVLTAPVKIMLIPVVEGQGISIMPDNLWRLKMQTFRVSPSKFESSGGLVGKVNEFSVSGSINVLQAGNLITVFFNIGTDAKLTRGISDTASGKTDNNSVVLPRIDAGNLVENPHPPLKATGKISDKNLFLSFESLPTMVADGFSGRGNLTGFLIK